MLLHAAPSHGPSLHRFLQRAEQNHVHHLPVIETLQNQRRKQSPILVPFQRKRHDASEQVNQHEERKENQGALHVLQRPQLRQLRDAQLRQAPQRDRKQKEQINQRRDQRQNNLEHHNIGDGEPAQRAVARLADG